MWQKQERLSDELLHSRRRVTQLPPHKTPEKQGAEQGDSPKNVNEVLTELDALIGLTKVKKLISELFAFVEIQKRRQKEKLINDPQVLHMLFRGNPGTGKTTMARIIGKLFKAMGILPKGHLVEVERADLVGEYIGHTAQKTREMLKKARGGVMFIDEAYSLARGGDKDFGKEAIDALVKGMEDNKDSLIVVLAGYQDEMDSFIETNPGLRSRFPIHLDFPDYSTGELMEIAGMMLQHKQYHMNEAAREELRRVIEIRALRHRHSGNARLVRNIVEKAIRRQAVRLVSKADTTRDELMTITREDIVTVTDNIEF
jgi:stage V sporulation protein K